MTDEYHECHCGQSATRFVIIQMINMTSGVLWECDDCRAERLAPITYDPRKDAENAK